MRLVAMIAILGGVAAAAWIVRARMRARPEVGSVSDQWIAEHQSDQPT
jgi:hypothetical protein